MGGGTSGVQREEVRVSVERERKRERVTQTDECTRIAGYPSIRLLSFLLWYCMGATLAQASGQVYNSKYNSIPILTCGPY